jgi:hypothetical protein
MKMTVNTENYLKEIQSVATKNLILSREVGCLIDDQNNLLRRNNELLEQLLSEIKDLAQEMKNN